MAKKKGPSKAAKVREMLEKHPMMTNAALTKRTGASLQQVYGVRSALRKAQNGAAKPERKPASRKSKVESLWPKEIQKMGNEDSTAMLVEAAKFAHKCGGPARAAVILKDLSMILNASSSG